MANYVLVILSPLIKVSGISGWWTDMRSTIFQFAVRTAF
jgi:hypothetical protein